MRACQIAPVHHHLLRLSRDDVPLCTFRINHNGAVKRLAYAARECSDKLKIDNLQCHHLTSSPNPTASGRQLSTWLITVCAHGKSTLYRKVECPIMEHSLYWGIRTHPSLRWLSTSSSWLSTMYTF
jgi:hypothetical protein